MKIIKLRKEFFLHEVIKLFVIIFLFPVYLIGLCLKTFDNIVKFTEEDHNCSKYK